MMDVSEIDYAAVLADLEAKRDALSAAIEAIRPLADASREGPAPSPTRRAPNGGALRPDAFFGMSILQAAKRYLEAMKQPRTAPDIAKALKTHGLLNDSKGFANTVYSVLYREAERGGRTVVKVGNAWGLSDWYPNRPKPQPKGKRSQNTAPNGGGDLAEEDPFAAEDEAAE